MYPCLQMWRRFVASICDAHVVRKALKGVQRLYHLAANPNLWTQKKSDFNLVNFEGTRTIFAEVAKHDIEVVVYTSTQSHFDRKCAQEQAGRCGCRM